MKSFILMTTGRSGSTALMNTLAKYPDVAVPNKQIDCIDNEILHPNFVNSYIPFYQQFSQVPISNEVEFINCFYQSNKTSTYAGFKSMPERHKQFQAIINSSHIQIITLIRRDIASTIASFIMAIDKKTWRRNGGKQSYSFTFSDQYKPRVLSHLKYIVNSRNKLKQFTNAISLEYEDLCQNDFEKQNLNQYFDREIKLSQPKPPVNAKNHVKTWNDFQQFIQQHIPS